MMKLVIGNKNYSSWSMRPWVLMRECGLPFEEVRLRFDSFAPDSAFKTTLAQWGGAGCVPLLVLDDGQVVWDSLAIVETLAERQPALWPTEARARAHARSLCAEMHAGFAVLRSLCPLNVEAELPAVGARLLAEHAALRADLARLELLWGDALASSGGPFLFGAYSAADAYYAPVALRMATYALPLEPVAAAYAQRLRATRGVQDWIGGALAEQDFRPFEEPYPTRR